jgi:hypothetical protein
MRLTPDFLTYLTFQHLGLPLYFFEFGCLGQKGLSYSSAEVLGGKQVSTCLLVCPHVLGPLQHEMVCQIQLCASCIRHDLMTCRLAQDFSFSLCPSLPVPLSLSLTHTHTPTHTRAHTHTHRHTHTHIHTHTHQRTHARIHTHVYAYTHTHTHTHVPTHAHTQRTHARGPALYTD